MTGVVHYARKKEKNSRNQEGKKMKVHRIFLIIFFSVVLHAPFYAMEKKEHLEYSAMPQFELDDMSPEEQTMLDTFEIEKPSFFVHWAQKIGGSFITSYTIVKHVLHKKLYQIKGWWRGQK